LLEVVYEGVAERLYGVSHALRSNRDYQKWMDYSRPAWTPIFNDPPPQPSDLQVDSQGSSQGGSAPAQTESDPTVCNSSGGFWDHFQDVRLPVIWSKFGPFGSTKELGPERVLLVSISW